MAVLAASECCGEGGSIAIKELYHVVDVAVIGFIGEDWKCFGGEFRDNVVDQKSHCCVALTVWSGEELLTSEEYIGTPAQAP